MKSLFIAVVMLLTTNMVFSQDANKRQKEFNLNGDHVAIKGYDPVTYFTESKAKKGKQEFAVYHNGINYYFSSAANKELFKKEPNKYEPQYGGWCAYAMGNDGTKVEVDPETFKVLNGKLYLFYNKFFTNTLKSWNKDEARLKNNADANWAKFIK
jgi:YHS domain-containing protein